MNSQFVAASTRTNNYHMIQTNVCIVLFIHVHRPETMSLSKLAPGLATEEGRHPKHNTNMPKSIQTQKQYAHEAWSQKVKHVYHLTACLSMCFHVTLCLHFLWVPVSKFCLTGTARTAYKKSELLFFQNGPSLDKMISHPVAAFCTPLETSIGHIWQKSIF